MRSVINEYHYYLFWDGERLNKNSSLYHVYSIILILVHISINQRAHTTQYAAHERCKIMQGLLLVFMIQLLDH